MKKISLTILLALSVVLLAACGNNSNNNTAGSNGGNTGTNAPATQNSLEAVKANGKLRIGTEGTYAPFTYHDTAGKLTGFDVEIAEGISKRLGVEAEFIETQWDGLFAGMDAKRFDVIFNQVSINEDRKVKYEIGRASCRERVF